MKSEPVLEVSDYYDGPREGIASLNGRLHRFKSRRLDVFEYKGDYESVDLFELTPVDSPKPAAPIIAKAAFYSAPEKETKVLPRGLVVTWEVLE